MAQHISNIMLHIITGLDSRDSPMPRRELLAHCRQSAALAPELRPPAVAFDMALHHLVKTGFVESHIRTDYGVPRIMEVGSGPVSLSPTSYALTFKGEVKADHLLGRETPEVQRAAKLAFLNLAAAGETVFPGDVAGKVAGIGQARDARMFQSLRLDDYLADAVADGPGPVQLVGAKITPRGQKFLGALRVQGF